MPALTRLQLREAYFAGRSLAYHLFPLPEYGVVYVKNPKAACSTVLLWLSRVHHRDDTLRPDNVHKEHDLPRPGDVGWRTTLDLLSGEGYRFTFVRDPLTRLESAYHDKIVRAAAPRWREPIQRILGVDSMPTFAQFLSAIERQDPAVEMDPHWRPQHVNLMHPLVTYDRVGKVETFAESLTLIQRESGLPGAPAEIRNEQRRRRGPSVYDDRPDLVERARAVYALDLELYGY